jgi:hypothetical protein
VSKASTVFGLVVVLSLVGGVLLGVAATAVIVVIDSVMARGSATSYRIGGAG